MSTTFCHHLFLLRDILCQLIKGFWKFNRFLSLVCVFRYTYRPILHFDIFLIDFVTQVCLAMASLGNSSFCFAFSEKCEQSFNGLLFHPLMCGIILLHSASHSMIGWLVTSELRVRALDVVGELCNRECAQPINVIRMFIDFRHCRLQFDALWPVVRTLQHLQSTKYFFNWLRYLISMSST